MRESTATALRPIDPADVLGDEEAMAAVRQLATWLRRADRGELATGTLEWATVAAVATNGVLPAPDLPAIRALARARATWTDDDGVRLSFVLFNHKGLVTFMPCTVTEHDVIYVGPDSVGLLKLAWQMRRGGRRALDLGSGTGFASAAMMSRYDEVVAADLDHRAAAATAITIALNRPPSRRAAVLRGDVGGALADGTFDLIIANPPWVPTDERLGGTVFADGGATGVELPGRFAPDAVRLLAPGGLALVLTLDLEHADGRRPAVRLVEDLRAEGRTVGLQRLDVPEVNDPLARKAADDPDLTAARLAAVVIERPRQQGARR